MASWKSSSAWIPLETTPLTQHANDDQLDSHGDRAEDDRKYDQEELKMERAPLNETSAHQQLLQQCWLSGDADQHADITCLVNTDEYFDRFRLRLNTSGRDQEQVDLRDAGLKMYGTAKRVMAFFGDSWKFGTDSIDEMADFLESMLNRQARHKLWKKASQDMRPIIKFATMQFLLYQAAIDFIRATLDKVPNQSKHRALLERVTKPLAQWLLRHKVSAHGCTFTEFERNFPSWLREYHCHTAIPNRVGAWKPLHIAVAETPESLEWRAKLSDIAGVLVVSYQT